MLKFRVLLFCILVVGVFSLSPGLAAEKPSVGGMQRFQASPAYFIPNRLNAKTGKRLQQSDVTAFVQTEHGRILFTSNGAYFGILSHPGTKQAGKGFLNPREALKQMDGHDPAEIVVMKVGFSPQKGTPSREPRLMEKTGGIVNFLIGNRENWQTKIPTYRKLVYENAWTNTDLQFLGFQNHLEYRIILRPGAKPDEVVMETGANSLSINENGSLVATLSDGTLQMSRPIAWQIVDGRKVAVDVQYRKFAGGRFGFALGVYDPAHTVTIDPTIEWASFTGADSAGTSGGFAVTVPTTSNGYTYATGVTSSSFFQTTTGAYDRDYNGGDFDAVVLKVNTSGQVITSTFLGGNQEDAGLDIAVDSAGNIYVTGYTYSTNFPVTSGAYQGSNNGNGDVFVVELDPNAYSLTKATCFGGSGEDQANAIAVTSSGVYLAGYTTSTDFPRVPGQSTAWIGYDTSHNGYKDGFVSELDHNLSTLLLSTYLGGSMNDEVTDMVLDEDANNIRVAGSTYSSDFPTTANALQSQNAGNSDGFVAILSPTGTGLDYSTYIGGSRNDFIYGVAIQHGLPYDEVSGTMIAGSTTSTDFPMTGLSYDTTLGGDQDAFVAEISAGGTLHYSTYIGGSSSDAAFGLDFGAGDEFLIAGVTASSDFPVTSGALDTTLNGTLDGFVTWVSTFASHIDYSTYLGGEANEYCTDVVVTHDPSLGAIVTGVTGSYDFPNTSGSWMNTVSLSAQGFLTYLNYHLDNIQFSSLFPNNQMDSGRAVSVDRFGGVYVAGTTYSENFPTTTGVVDNTADPIHREGFVTRFESGSAVSFSTYLGGSSRDEISDLALDSQYRPVLVGNTTSSDFPSTAPAWGASLHDLAGDGDGFVTKLSADGSSLIFSGFLGGTSTDKADCVAIDSNGYICVGGSSLSSDFPVSSGSWDNLYNGLWDGTVTKFSPDGNSIIFSSFLGGASADFVIGLSIGADDSIYLTGGTSSTDFPTASATHPFQDSYYGTLGDAFATRMSADGSSLIFSTYLGGRDYDQGEAILATGTGEVWIAGTTSSSEFPVTAGCMDSTENGTSDGFVAKLSADGSVLNVGTLFGGSGDETVYGIVQNPDGNIVIAGMTTSADFPVTGNAIDSSLGGSADAYAAQISTDLSTLQYSTYIGGSHQDYAYALAADRYGRIYITGTTDSPDFPVTTDAYDTTNDAGFDAFVCKLDWSAYTIHATYGTSGAIIPNGDIPVQAGGMKTFYIYPDNGYLIQDVLVDGISQGMLTHYTFTNVMADHTIDVQFAVATDPPVINSFTVHPVSGDAPLTSTYRVTAHAGTGRTIAAYVWQLRNHNIFGTGDFTTETQNSQIQHTIYWRGDYSARVCVIDDTGAGTWSNSIDLSVLHPAPLPQPANSPIPGAKTGESVTNTAVNPGSMPISVTLQAFDSNHNEVGTSEIIVPQYGTAELSLDPFSNLDYTDVEVVSDTGLLFFSHLSDGAANMTAYLNQSQFDTLYLPHIAEETTYWNTYAFLTNQQKGSVTATVAGQDFPLESDETLSVDLEAMLPQPVDELTAWGSFRGTSNNPFSSVPTLSGYEMFVKEGSDGAATELVNRLAYTLYIPHIPEETDIFWTGFAIINPGTEDAVVDFNFYDDNGLFVGHESKTIPAGEKLKGLMTDLFPDEAGNAKWGLISSDQALTGIEIFGTYQAGICGLTLPDNAQQSGILPDVWTGENNWTGFSLTNMGAFTANVLVQLYDKDGILKAQHTESIGTLNRFKAVVGDYFTGITLAQGDSIRFTSDQPLTALEVSGDLGRTVMAALTAAQ